MKNLELFTSSKSNEWETPKYVFDYFNKIYNFELDAAATKENTLCPNFYTIEDDSLTKNWNFYKTVWCNPPYGRQIGKFIEKGYYHSLGVSGSDVCFLIPARTDTKWWHNYCVKGTVYFIKGRLKFVNKTSPSYREGGDFKLSPAPFPCAIVIFNGKDPKTEYLDFKNI